MHSAIQRHLDLTLCTTHSHVRIFLVTAKCCVRAVWLDEKDELVRRLGEQHYLSLRGWGELLSSWWWVDYRFRVHSFLMLLFQAVQGVLLGAGDCGARYGLARRNGQGDFVVKGVLGIRGFRWGAQSSCWTGVV